MSVMDRQFEAYLDKMNMVTILLPAAYHEGKSSSFTLVDDNVHTRLRIVNSEPVVGDRVKYTCDTVEPLVIGKCYWIIDEHSGKTDLQIGAVIRTAAFDEAYYYDGELGVVYQEESSCFRLWAPTASKVKLKLQSHGENIGKEITMQRKEKGLWTVSVKGNLDRWRYTYLVCVNKEWQEAVDPYAVAVTTNGRQGVIIDLQKTAVKKPELPPFTNPTDAIIYETHIRDFTIHPNSGAVNKGKYAGVAETGTATKEGAATGLDYVKQLGITHLEFLPFHDFEGVDETRPLDTYNWGYNPLHFNAPDGSYASDPGNPYARVNELKEMIRGVQAQGIRVIMDVVYNHVYIREHSSFEKIVPGYFFRHDAFGMPSNGTGVGNDIASERLMVRKFILDSVLFWLQEYQVDGFRFDLMGILDVDTMNLIRKRLDEVDPTILLIGEGWDLNTPIEAHRKASIRNQARLLGIAHFNDWFRDSIKGSTFNLYDKGYAMGNDRYYEAAKQVIAGSIGVEKKEKGLFLSPAQSVNYVESHDNHTLWDKIKVCIGKGETDKNERKARLATVITLLSQGIPFLHSGQEFFRTKNGVGNSYRSPDSINQIDWDRKSQYIENAKYTAGIIAIRKSHQGFRLPTAELIRNHLLFLPESKPVIAICLNNVGEFGRWEKILIYLNPSHDRQTVQLPEGNWSIIADENQAGTEVLTSVQGNLELAPISSYVLVTS